MMNKVEYNIIIGEVTWSPVLKTTMDCHSKLVLHSLGNNQPVHVVIHQRRRLRCEAIKRTYLGKILTK